MKQYEKSRKRGKKQNEVKRRRDFVRKRKEKNKLLQQYERFQNREHKNKDNIDVVWFFKVATSDNRLFVDSSKLHGIRNEILGDYTGDFELIGDNINAEHRQQL